MTTADTGHSIVIIHGLYGSGKDLAEEAANGWTIEYLKTFSPGSRLILFEWESHKIFAGTETEAFVRAVSQGILLGLVNIGGEESMVCVSESHVFQYLSSQKNTLETIGHVCGR